MILKRIGAEAKSGGKFGCQGCPTPREADPPSALVCGAVFGQFFQGKIGLRSQSRRAAYAHVRWLYFRLLVVGGILGQIQVLEP